MRRTNVYLTDEQRSRLARRAKDAGVSEAEVLRRILDEALGINDRQRERIAAIDSTAGVLADAPDWPDWLQSVRGRGADERLKGLGL
ncbi:MAG: antitoxin [Deltaproteobacteria bacterium]|nr:antitoxin [Deltaproteobacteria bacterium]